MTVVDCAAATEKGTGLGGEVVAGPMDIADYGRMTNMRDSQGAVIHLWQPRINCGVGVLDEPGTVCLNELMTSDTEGAEEFYTNLFDWGTETVETPTLRAAGAERKIEVSAKYRPSRAQPPARPSTHT